MPIDNCPLIFILATCHRRKDTHNIPVFKRLILLPVNPINQYDFRDLFWDLEPFQNILHPGVTIDLHLAGKTAAPSGKIIP